jgi:hypothetical protein
MPPCLELQNRGEIGCTDKGFVFGPFLVVERTVVGAPGKDIDPFLDGWIDAKLNHSLS